MPRITRNTKPTDDQSETVSDKPKMASKTDLTLQDVIDQMTSSMKVLETKMVTKIDENAEKVSATLKTSEQKLDIIEKNTTDLSIRVEELENDVRTKDQHIDALSKKIYDLEQEKRDHHVIKK